MGKRSNFERRPQDDYRTIDPRAVKAIRPYLYGVRTFSEPCAGQLDLVTGLQSVGLTCVHWSDIITGTDALTLTDLPGDAIITNPPWTRKILHPMILHFQHQLPTWLIFDSDWAYNKLATPYLDQCSDIVAVGRLKWIPDSKHTGKDNVSWYRFWHKHQGGPRFHGRK